MKTLRHNRAGATLIEVMAMLVVLALALTTMFVTLMQGINFSRDVEARITAINLAREGIEGVINIRNTNWLRFSSDRTHCWNTYNYNAECIGSSNFEDTIASGSYILYADTTGLWKLSEEVAWNNDNWSQSFKDYNMGVTGIGTGAWYTGNPHALGVGHRLCNSNNRYDCRSMFAREIVISDVTGTGFTATATVHWYNTSQKKVSLQAEITNWKSLYDKR